MSAAQWCRRCGVRHEADGVCYGMLEATEPERYGWRVRADSSGGKSETFGVLIAQCGDKWRARIVTLPNMLWSVPGGQCTMKFVADTAGEAEDQARRFIGRICQDRGLKMTEVPVEQQPRAITAEGKGMDAGQATRNVQGLPARYGVDRADQDGRTSDLSANGLFLAADRLIPVGGRIKLNVQLGQMTVPLSGAVIWVREQPDGGRPKGMGVQLHGPPALYTRYTEELRKQLLAEQKEPVSVG